jgi:hypothetical protein
MTPELGHIPLYELRVGLSTAVRSNKSLSQSLSDLDVFRSTQKDHWMPTGADAPRLFLNSQVFIWTLWSCHGGADAIRASRGLQGSAERRSPAAHGDLRFDPGQPAGTGVTPIWTHLPRPLPSFGLVVCRSSPPSPPAMRVCSRHPDAREVHCVFVQLPPPTELPEPNALTKTSCA